MRSIRGLTIIILNVGLSIFSVILVVLLLDVDRLWLPPLPGFLEILSWPLFIAGTTIIISSVYILFKYSGTSGAPGDPTQNLVDKGIYRWMRNPIYLGDILLLFGVGFNTRSILLTLLAVTSIPAFHYFVLKIEEPKTRNRLGEVYIQYKKNVPRWFPRLTKLITEHNGK